VTIYLPETVLIDPEVTVGPDTVIEPGTQLLGKTRVGARCQIRTGTILHDVRVDDGAIVGPHSNIDSSRVGPNAQVGPFSRLRPGADIRAGARVGNFVEVKKSVIHEGAKAQHLSYLGDATVGPGSNIGAGTITCNYDGAAKHETKIGKGVFIGSDTALVAPVRIGDGAYVAAGSVITENVPPDALAIARGRQVNKPGWAKARRAQLKHATHGKTKSRPKRRLALRSAKRDEGPRRARAKSRPRAKSRRR
jgi:bifunctional UDP-N-acetylglucosamine pyrophosphorylase/glucosamine-1-phosphate N-acetyltransferase